MPLPSLTPRRLGWLCLAASLAFGASIAAAEPRPQPLGLDPGDYRLNDRVPALPEGEGPVALDPPEELVLRIEQGESFAEVLEAEDIPAAEIAALRAALEPLVPAGALGPGREFSVILRERAPGEATVLELHLIPDPNQLVTVTRAPDGSFAAERREVTIVARPVRVAGTIGAGFDETMFELRVPAAAARQAARALSYDVDFQRDVRRGHRFEILYERLMTEGGNTVGTGAVLYGALTLGHRVLRVYRFAGPDGRAEYFNERGESVRRSFLRTPVDRPRVTSRFGQRRHPILGYSRMHRGVDFGAPTGTRVLAASSGTVDMIGWNAGYGRYVRIRHDNGFHTAYGHLSAFARGLRAGSAVRQGQVIGRVGMTGLATGPHLHYEVHRNGAQINPLSVRVIGGRRLAGRELAAFVAQRGTVDRQVAQLGGAAPAAQIAARQGDAESRARGAREARRHESRTARRGAAR